MQIGYKRATEAFGPAETIRQAVLADELAEPLRALQPGGGGVRDQD
jgi:hypothetical protein